MSDGDAGGARRHFRRAARDYDERMSRGLLGVVRRRERCAVRTLLSPQAGESILDAGCGSGFDAVPLLALGCRVRGVDLAPEMVARAKERGVDASVADLHELDLGCTFDKVLCCGALEFCREPPVVLARLAAHVRPGGRLVLLYPTRTLVGRLYSLYHRRHGVRVILFDDSTLDGVLEENGLRVVSHEHPTPFTGVLRADRTE